MNNLRQTDRPLPTESSAAYDKKYEEGYGLQYPDGHVIRCYERVFRYELGLSGGRLLDFGCGNGVHSKYFMGKGFDCYGVDIAAGAIRQAQVFMGEKAIWIQPNQSLKRFFSDGEFDVVFSNQVLYYMNDTDLNKWVKELYDFTKPGGICFFTMMSSYNCYSNFVTEEYENGLSKIVLDHRLHETTYINFIKDEEHLKKVFAPFVPLHIGYYDYGFLHDDSENGSSHHYIFIGKKEFK